jgi:hypothetical protein
MRERSTPAFKRLALDDRTSLERRGRWALGTKTVGVDLGKSAQVLLRREHRDNVTRVLNFRRSPG